MTPANSGRKAPPRKDSGGRYTVQILDEQKHLDLNHPHLSLLAQKVLTAEKALSGHLGVWFTDDAHIKKHHKKYLNKNTVTDVISFGYPKSAVGAEPPHLGDVMVSVERAVKVCGRYKEAPDREAARYMVHGILHLLGYDDQGVRQNRRMSARQERHLAAHPAGTFLAVKRRIKA